MPKKKTAKQVKRKNQNNTSPEKASRNYEITGICIIALSIFFAISVYSDNGGTVGTFISSVLMGLFGYCAYLLPVIMLSAIIYFLFCKDKHSARNKMILSAVAFINLTAIFHIINCAQSNVEFSKYYSYAQLHPTGGIVGASVGMPMQSFLGIIGADILFFSLLIILVICIFNISVVRVLNGIARLISGTVEHICDDINIIKEENKKDAKQTEDEQFNPIAHIDVKVDPKKIKESQEYIKAAEQGYETMPHNITINMSEDTSNSNSNKDKEFIDHEEEVTQEEPHLTDSEKEQLDCEIKREMETTAAEKGDLILQYTYPSIDLLSKPKQTATPASSANELQKNAMQLVETLHSFKVDARVVEISQGPTITRYEIKPAEGVKVNQITSLSRDIALSLAAEKDVIVAPVPGKSTIGIELANKVRSDVMLRDVIDSDEFRNHPSKLAVALGKDISGKPIIMDLAKMPHLLIAGATGAGKSVCINTLVISLLYKANPNEVKLVMIDPKQVELGVYNGIPHLLIPVVKDPKKATGALGWAVKEMTERYSIFEQNNVRNIQGYNELMERNGTPEGKMPSIVILIDEFADLMMVAPGDVENYVCRIAQLARAAGMHLVIATQRPVVKFITGNIKANVPSRISFMVASVRDSQTILDMGGAEKLIGKGDMLYMPVGETKPSRMQCAFVSDADVKKIVGAVSSDCEPIYDESVIEQLEEEETYEPDGSNPGDADELLPEAIEMAVDSGTISASLLQRRFRIGYNRAGSLVDQMEKRGIISGPDGNKPRQVLITRDQYNEMLMK